MSEKLLTTSRLSYISWRGSLRFVSACWPWSPYWNSLLSDQPSRKCHGDCSEQSLYGESFYCYSSADVCSFLKLNSWSKTMTISRQIWRIWGKRCTISCRSWLIWSLTRESIASNAELYPYYKRYHRRPHFWSTIFQSALLVRLIVHVTKVTLILVRM